MPCYHPVQGFQRPGGAFSLSSIGAYRDLPMTIPCNQCIGCLNTYSGSWAVRCMHESSSHQACCFVTLTYGNDHYPADGSVHKMIFSKFMRRLRKEIGSKSVRYFACGEYGEDFQRPHYHGCLFGFAFPDRVPSGRSDRGQVMYQSELLAKVWPYGAPERQTIQDFTPATAAYVAKYAVKKKVLTGKNSTTNVFDPVLGCFIDRTPECLTMSTKPGIGSAWFSKFESDAFPSGFVVVDGKKVIPPRSYKKKYVDRLNADTSHGKLLNPELASSISKGAAGRRRTAHDNTPERLATRELAVSLRSSTLKNR